MSAINFRKAIDTVLDKAGIPPTMPYSIIPTKNPVSDVGLVTLLTRLLPDSAQIASDALEHVMRDGGEFLTAAIGVHRGDKSGPVGVLWQWFDKDGALVRLYVAAMPKRGEGEAYRVMPD